MLTNRARLMGVSRYCRQLVDQELAWWETIAINPWMGGQEMIEFYIKKAKNCDVKLFLWSNHSPSATVKRSFTGFWDMISTAGLLERVISLSIQAHPREFMTFLPLPSPLSNLKKLRIRNSDLHSNPASQWDSSTLHMLGSKHSLLQEHLPNLQHAWIEGLNPNVLGAGHSQFPHLTSLHYVGGEAECPKGAWLTPTIHTHQRITALTVDCGIDSFFQSNPAQVIHLPALVTLESLSSRWSQVLRTPALQKLVCYDSRFQSNALMSSWDHLEKLSIFVPSNAHSDWAVQSQDGLTSDGIPNIRFLEFFLQLQQNPFRLPKMKQLRLLGVKKLDNSILLCLSAILQNPQRRHLKVIIPKSVIPRQLQNHFKSRSKIAVEERPLGDDEYDWVLTSRL
ncbi:hypothetical protein DL93DRAFT_2101923 [Clavulina sp. PMI_390]|nr:hypothetical protein DL93DRAFT_2101923 [Clavulina sp. PMI_390]